jgi:hypothetical protein
MMIYFERTQPELYQGRNLDREYHRFAHRQRVEFVHSYDEKTTRDAIGRFLGDEFKAVQGYEGPGEGVGNTIIPATFYGPGKTFDERESAYQAADAWISFLKQTLQRSLTFLYLPDEPRASQFPYIKKLAENVHSNPGPGRELRTFVTRSYADGLEGAIDIWCSPTEGYDIERAKAERAKGRAYWIYNGRRPFSGAIIIDAPATDPRATIWGCFKHGIDAYFYWHGDHWRHNSQKQGERIQNVWVNPITFDNRGQPNKEVSSQSFANGDGVLYYPGEEKQHPVEDRGIKGPCSTIQLANFRRGLQDHQYLTLARSLELGAVVDEALQSVVPQMFSDVKKDSPVAFAERGDVFEAARRKLALAITAKRKDSGRGITKQRK